MLIKSQIDELEKIQIEIKRNNASNKVLRNRAKEIEQNISSYLEEKDEPGLKYNGKAIVVENKERRLQKSKKDRKSNVVTLLEDLGIDEADNVYDKILDVQKKSPVSERKIKLKKLKSFLEKVGVLNKIDFDIEEVGEPYPFKWGKCKLATVSFGHGITTTPLQLAKGYSIITNGGFDIKPTLIKRDKDNINNKNRIIKEGISEKLNPILRKIVTNKEGTAELANIDGYEVGGKTGTAQKTTLGGYSNLKVNTFASIFPTSKPKYALIVLLDEPKTNSEYIYYYKDGKQPTKGTPYNTAGWTSVEVAGNIIERIGPILATKHIEN